MATKKFVYWIDHEVWVGYLEEFPDYMTQGETFNELKANLKDIYKELTGGLIPNVRHVDELEIA